MSKTLFACAAAAVGALTLTSPAAAAVTLVFDPTNNKSVENTGASATATFEFFNDASGDVRIEISVKNTTGEQTLGDGATAATLVGIAFDLPSLTSAMVAGDYNANATAFTKFWANPDFQPFTTPSWGNLAFDYAFSPTRNQFGGGNANSGLTAGNTLGTVKFLADTTLTAAQFEAAFLNGYDTGAFTAGARFQQVSGGRAGGSDKVLGALAVVPEPGTWALMILGFGGAGAMLRRRRAVAA